MDRSTLKREFPLGNPYIDDKFYDPVTAIAIASTVAAGTGVAGAVAASETRREQEKATKKSEATAAKAQAEQEALALKEKKASDTKLEEQRARILKGQQGRGGLLFGSELGTEATTDKKQTLGV